MTDPEPQTDSDSRSISFEVSSPDGVLMVHSLLNLISENDGVYRVSIEAESTEPFTAVRRFFADGEQPSMASAAQPATTASSVGGAEAGIEPATPGSEPTEAEADVSDVFVCEYCQDTFDTKSALNGHLRWCDEYEKHKESEGDPDVPPIDPDFSISIGTWQYKAASTLLHADGSLTPSEVADRLADTDWEQTKKRLSEPLGSLAEAGVADRTHRSVDNRGSNPYEYWLTDAGVEVIDAAEDEARDADVPTYLDVVDGEVEEVDDPGAEEGSEEGEDGEDGATGEAEDEEFTCDECGEGFPTAGALGSHVYYKHGEGASDDAEAVSLAAGSSAFRVASTLYHASKPSLPRNLEERLEGTEWEQSRSNISATLGTLHDAGVVEREQRAMERGKPYEYHLTDEGAGRVEAAIEDAEDAGDTTYEDVIAGK